MKHCYLNFTLGILSAVLLSTLIYRLQFISQGMNISGVFLGSLIIFAMIVGCLILTKIIRLVIPKTLYWRTLFISINLSFVAFHIQLYMAS